MEGFFTIDFPLDSVMTIRSTKYKQGTSVIRISWKE